MGGKISTAQNGEIYEIKSTDVNEYLGEYTTKNFRTWGANLEFIIQLLKHEIPDTITGKKRNVNESLQKVYSEINELERTEIEVMEYQNFTELYSWFTIPAALLSLTFLVTTRGIFGKLL